MHAKRKSLIAGNAKLVAIAVVAAIGLGAKFAWDMYHSGARDLSYIFFMSLAAVVALVMVAPRQLLRRGSEEEDDWGNDRTRIEQRETPMPADPSNSSESRERDSPSERRGA